MRSISAYMQRYCTSIYWLGIRPNVHLTFWWTVAVNLCKITKYLKQNDTKGKCSWYIGKKKENFLLAICNDTANRKIIIMSGPPKKGLLKPELLTFCLLTVWSVEEPLLKWKCRSGIFICLYHRLYQTLKQSITIIALYFNTSRMAEVQTISDPPISICLHPWPTAGPQVPGAILCASRLFKKSE